MNHRGTGDVPPHFLEGGDISSKSSHFFKNDENLNCDEFLYNIDYEITLQFLKLNRSQILQHCHKDIIHLISFFFKGTEGFPPLP